MHSYYIVHDLLTQYGFILSFKLLSNNFQHIHVYVYLLIKLKVVIHVILHAVQANNIMAY